MRSFWMLLFVVLMPISAASGEAPTHFISHPQAGTPEVQGHTKVLICNATGSPSPSYRWLKDGRGYQPTGRSGVEAGALRLRSIQRGDAGRYQCIASNSQGALLSSSAHLHVAYMRPFSNGGNSNKFVSLGRAVVIDLPPIDCYPAPSVEWYDGGGGTRVSRESTVYHVTLRNQLVILDARPTIDSRMFRATATNVISQQTTDSQLFIVKIEHSGGSVGDVGPEIVVPPVDAVVVSASDDDVARLECVANARPLSHLILRWYRRVQSTQEEDEEPPQWEPIAADDAKYQLSPFNRLLTILRPTPADAGLYRCEAAFRRTPTTTVTASATVAAGQVATADATLTVHVKPSIVVSPPRELEAEVETAVVLPCQASGSPKPSIAWYYNAELISPTRYSSSSSSNGSLVIDRASTSQSGVYQCFATSEAGEANSVTMLTVTSFVPEMVVLPLNQTVVSGDTITLPCAASGAPRPSVSWSKVSAAMASRESVGSVRQSSNDLVLSYVSITDTGIYTCTATNNRGTASATAYLQVAIRTRIVTPPHDTTVRRGSDVMLTCGVVSDTRFPVSWQWSFNGVLLDMTDVRHRQRMPDGSLHLRSADGSDIGSYICQVVSLGGNDSANARLNVVELPHQPTIISARLSDHSETSVDLRWSPPSFNGNSKIRKFIIYAKMLNPDVNDSRSLGSEAVEEWKASGYVGGKDSTDYTIHQLRPSQSYQFQVSATNEVGEGRPSLSTAPIAIPPQAPSSPPRGVVGSPRSNSSIILHWQPPDRLHWNGPLLGYQISHKPAGYPDSALSFTNISDPSKLFAEIGHLEPFHEYDVAIAAYNARGIGTFSLYARVRTQEGRPVAPPTDVDAVPVNSTALRVSWTSPHQRYINGINQGYKVIVMSSTDDTEVVHVFASNTSNMVGRQSGHVTGLRKFAAYSVSVLCFTSKGDGPRSRPVAMQTLEDVPDQVGSLAVSSKIDTRIDVSWAPPQSPNGLITGYVVRCRLANQVEWMASVDLPSNANNFTISGLAARTAYHVDVAARTRVGVGESYLVAVETGVAPERPQAPLSILIVSFDSTSIELQVAPSISDHSSIIHWIVEAERRQFPVNIPQWKEFSVSPGSSSTLLLVGGFQPDVEYRVRVLAENVAGRSAPSDPSDWFRTLAAAPSFPPEKVALQPLNATTVVATWTPLLEALWNGRSRRYAVRYWPCHLSDEKRSVVSTEDADTVSLTIGELEEWTVYCVQLAACNEMGCSEYSDGGITSARTLESVPSSGPVSVSAVTVNSTAINVSWSNISEVHRNGRILGYKVFYRSTVDVSDSIQTLVTSKESQTKSLLLTDLDKFTWYQIRVAAFTRSGDGATSSGVATTQTSDDVPGAPSGVYFPEVSESSARIAWSPPSQPNGIVTGYRVVYVRKDRTSTGNVFPVIVDESLGRERSDYLAKNLDANASYVFTVAAQSRHGWGESTEVEVFTTSLLRSVPDRPVRPSFGQSDIGSRWVVIGGLTLDPSLGGNSDVKRIAPIRNYTVQVQLNGGRFLTEAQHIPHNVSEFNITRLVPYSRYALRLAASNDVGLSEFSESSDPFQTHLTHPDHPPTDVTIVQQSSTSALVRWKPPKDDGLWNGDKVGYQVWYRHLAIDDSADKSSDNDDLYSTVTTVYPRSNVLLTDLLPNVILEVKVAAVNRVGRGPTSDPVDLFLCEAAPSLVPEDLRASAVTPTAILLTWKRIESQDSQDITADSYLGYKIYYWISGRQGDTTRVKSLSLADNQTLVSNLRMYTEYAFIVAAFGSGGSGPNSSVPAVAKTLDGLPGSPEQLTIAMTSPSSVNLTWKPPSDPNGVIEGYELTYFQEALVDGESKSVRVLLSGEKTTYQARDLVSEANYTFRLNAKTRHGSGPETTQTITIGPQPGSPGAPDRPESTESDLGLVVTWNAPLDSGSSPLVSYILQYRQYDGDPTLSDWTSVTVSASQSLGSKVTISSQQLIRGASYEFRAFAVNSQGISMSSLLSEHFYSAAEVASQAEPSATVPFYKQWWFLLSMAVAGLAIILIVVASLCITRRRRAKAVSRDKSQKKRNGDAKTIHVPVMSIDDETGFATIERRHPPSWGGQKYPKASTLPLYSRAPPRPSPGSIMYDTDLISQHEDSGNVSDKASNNGDSDVEEANQLATFLKNASKRPQSFCATPLDDNPHPPYTVSLNGGHSVMPKYQTMRPPKLSSFV